MLAGCSSSSLLSPRHRLKSESTQACHFQLPSSMNTQRLDLPCSNFSRKDTATSARPQQQSVRPKPVEANRSLKQHIRLPPLATTAGTATSAFVEVKGEFWEGGGAGNNRRSLKRSVDDDESCIGRAKRKKSDEFGIGNAFWFGEEEEEERVCFVTEDRVPPLSGINWVDFGEEVETSKKSPGFRASASPSSASSESQSLVLRLNEVGTTEVGGASRSSPLEGSQSRQVVPEVETHHKEFELVSMLISCVEAVASKNIPAINHFIAKLGDLASPVGPTALSRLTAYYTEALALRVSRLWPHIFHITTPREVDRTEDELGTALRVLNQVTPIPKFIHFTANEIMLRAFEGKERVHIIDFDIKQGLQWPSLFQSLASRTPPPRHVRITGIGDSKQELIETGARLSGFAEALNLEFEFHPVVDRIEDVRLWMLHVKEGESVAVNCVLQLHKTLYDTSGQSLRDFLGLVRSTNPAVLVVAEQEVDNNSVLLESRIVSSLQYYCALFDSVGSAPPGARARVEEMFGREIRNVVACEGSDRIERHERFDLWEKSMERVGIFRGLEISEREKLQVEMLLRMYGDEGYRVTRVGSGITLSFENQPLYTVSAWVPVDHIGASSSSFSQLS